MSEPNANDVEMIRIEGEGLLVTVDRPDGTVSTFTMSDEQFARLAAALDRKGER